LWENMKGDFTRDTFDRRKHFLRVLMQQGRVQLDADYNEENSIILHYLQCLAKDLLGTHGGPFEGCGFEIIPIKSEKNSDWDLAIGCGHYYVDGILCENDSPTSTIMRVKRSVRKSESKKDFCHAWKKTSEKPERLREVKVEHLCVTTYNSQSDYPLPESEKLTLKAHTPLIVYLDVWERYMSHLDDPDIREVALGGADTCGRTKLVSQVKICTSKTILTDTIELDNNGIQTLLQEKFQPNNRGKMKARAGQLTGDKSELSNTYPKIGYRGMENQLYRVEIHQGTGQRQPTFKWSRENGSVAFPLDNIAGKMVTLKTLGQDSRKSLSVGDLVEIEDDDYTLQNRAERLLEIEKIDSSNLQVFLKEKPESTVGADPKKHPLLRRWDHKKGDPEKGGLTLDGGAAVVRENVWLDLEDGIQIFFENGGQTYRTGDYWLIPARTMTRDIEWPRNHANPDSIPSHGVMHHYAPLAIISIDNKTFRVRDCRLKFGAQMNFDLRPKCYTINSDDGEVVFGDGESGEKPPEGNDQISTSYRKDSRIRKRKNRQKRVEKTSA
jgi:Family of unknown function (DUF6519)